jgi:leucyl-tRNA synthetase
MVEELWSLYGNVNTLTYEPWPEVDENLLKEDSHEYPVSFNGKMRFKLKLPIDVNPKDVEGIVKEHEMAQRWLDGKTIRKVIFVPQKIINIVVG